MRRIFCIALLFIVSKSIVSAQLLVNEDGNVGVKVSNESVNSFFSINGSGDSKICTFVLSDTSTQDIGIRIFKRGQVNTANSYTEGIISTVRQSNSSARMAYGVYGQAYKEAGGQYSGGRSYGVFGLAGHATPGWNYGVLGTLYGNSTGAGIYGSSEDFDMGMAVGDKYAGFFHGKVKATDAMYATAFNTISDIRLKENIESIEPQFLADLMNLNVVKYNIKQYNVNESDTSSIQMNYYTDEKLLLRNHYGLIAQELKEVYPDLVDEGADGFLSVNYIEIIPLLIKAVQELTAKVDELESNNERVSIKTSKAMQANSLESDAVLFQNNPNPFTENTIISCLIPKNINNAIIYIYDMNGRQIDDIVVSERGKVTITIEGRSLDAGIYIYSLITDGNLIDTKRMILTK